MSEWRMARDHDEMLEKVEDYDRLKAENERLKQDLKDCKMLAKIEDHHVRNDLIERGLEYAPNQTTQNPDN